MDVLERPAIVFLTYSSRRRERIQILHQPGFEVRHDIEQLLNCRQQDVPRHAFQQARVDRSIDTPLLEAVDINVAKWVEGVERYGSRTRRVVGHIEAICLAATHSTVKLFKGRDLCDELFVAHDPAPG